MPQRSWRQGSRRSTQVPSNALPRMERRARALTYLRFRQTMLGEAAGIAGLPYGGIVMPRCFCVAGLAVSKPSSQGNKPAMGTGPSWLNSNTEGARLRGAIRLLESLERVKKLAAALGTPVIRHRNVVPAEAVTHANPLCQCQKWIPALAGMTLRCHRWRRRFRFFHTLMGRAAFRRTQEGAHLALRSCGSPPALRPPRSHRRLRLRLRLSRCRPRPSVSPLEREAAGKSLLGVRAILR
jgi:hypothetical protein